LVAAHSQVFLAFCHDRFCECDIHLERSSLIHHGNKRIAHGDATITEFDYTRHAWSELPSLAYFHMPEIVSSEIMLRVREGDISFGAYC
jgi:hypothetical protein